MYSIPFLDLPPLGHAAGTVHLPGSKSISNRLLLLAGLSAGTTTLVDLLDSDDTRVMLDALRTLVQQHKIYRIKGFVALPGAAMRLVVQGVGTRFDSYFDRAWWADEARATQLVLIGAELDGAALQAQLDAALR